MLSGTTVVAGRGRFQAAAVGADAYANPIAAEAQDVHQDARSEIQASINTLLKYITWVIVLALPLQIWSQVAGLRRGRLAQVDHPVTGGLVGLVPEGLVLLTSVAFLLAAVALTRQQVLVQELPAVEGLARVDVVCLDKTGTLTVGDIVYEGCEPVGEPAADDRGGRAALGALADDPNANGTLKALAAPLDRSADGWERTQTIAFNSARKWSAASLRRPRRPASSARPDVLLPADDPLRDAGRGAGRHRPAGRCSLGHSDGRPRRARCCPPASGRWPSSSLSEQVRPGRRETLDYFAEQGVDVKVISGDNPEHRGRDRPPRSASTSRTTGCRRPHHRHRRRGAARDGPARPRCSAG